jgi:voltage-gated potassium channel
VLVVATSTVVLGAIGVYALEAGENKGIQHFGDALWWAVTTVTTVGYGDITPITPEGRLIAVVLMLTGISVIGVFTATVASFLFEAQQAESSETADIIARLDRIEKSIEALRQR